jgi:hypothetical protein
MFDTSYYDEDELPAELLPLTSPDLDTDRAAAGRAAELLLRAHRHVLDNICELEMFEQALRRSESASTRAQEARIKIRRALLALESGISATSEARDAMAFHWT